MNSRPTARIGGAALAVVGVVFSATTTLAQDSPPEPEALLPQPVNERHFQAVLKHSPFLRTLDFSETYSLRGVAEIDGTQVATLYNRESKKSVTVTAETANDQGMTLVEVVPAQNLTGVMAKIAVGGEEVEFKFENDRIAPQPKGGGRGGPPSKSGSSGERRGPSKEDIERYKSLSDEKKEKLRNFIRGTMQKYPNMSREERGNMIRGAMQKLVDGRDIEVPQSSGSPQGGGDRGGGGSDRGGGRPGGDR